MMRDRELQSGLLLPKLRDVDFLLFDLVILPVTVVLQLSKLKLQRLILSEQLLTLLDPEVKLPPPIPTINLPFFR